MFPITQVLSSVLIKLQISRENGFVWILFLHVRLDIGDFVIYFKRLHEVLNNQSKNAHHFGVWPGGDQYGIKLCQRRTWG